MARTRTRSLERSRQEILKAAFLSVFAKGFQGVSVDDIVVNTRLTKGAFYHQFPTKLALGYALVEEVITPMILERWIEPLKAHEDPLNGILHLMERLIGQAKPESLAQGCPLNNLVQEMAPLDRGFRKRLEKALRLWIDEMEHQLRRGQASGFLRKDVNTAHLAHFVVMAHEGFYGMLKGLSDPEAFPALYGSLSAYFDSLR